MTGCEEEDGITEWYSRFKNLRVVDAQQDTQIEFSQIQAIVKGVMQLKEERLQELTGLADQSHGPGDESVAGHPAVHSSTSNLLDIDAVPAITMKDERIPGHIKRVKGIPSHELCNILVDGTRR